MFNHLLKATRKFRYRKSLSLGFIKDTLANNKEICIKAFQLPIINKELLNQGLNARTSLKDLFEPTRIGIKEKIEITTILEIMVHGFN